MNQPTSRVEIEVLTEYAHQDAIEIGNLLPHLDASADGQPLSEQMLRDIIASPYHDQLVARNENSQIVGIATLSITMGTFASRSAYLEDFVVDPRSRGTGVSDLIWNAMIDWCQEKNAHQLGFTSRPSRTAAQEFYLKHGATIRDTNCFKKTIN